MRNWHWVGFSGAALPMDAAQFRRWLERLAVGDKAAARAEADLLAGKANYPHPPNLALPGERRRIE